jgi:hypothetical protein
MGLLKNLGKRRRTRKIIGDRRILHLPDDLASPDTLAVYSGRRREDIWTALFLLHSVQHSFPDNRHLLICRDADSELSGTLQWIPDTVTYSDSPCTAAPLAGERMTGRSILFHPYPEMDSETASFIASSGAPVCVSTSADPVVNVRVKVGKLPLPERLYRMCEILGMSPDRKWGPSVPASYAEGASAILAPVSGRALPYIAATTAAAGILEKRRAEIPVRMVVVEGKRREIPEVSRGIMAAIVGGASAVVTTDPGLWLKARALGVPAVGLDRNDRFPDWGGAAARTEDDFIDGWSDLLRRGW